MEEEGGRIERISPSVKSRRVLFFAGERVLE